ncbi:hypothetical protein BJ165DRAFT_1419873 [Panaeolus papilionaceus]|nr:hypothetical protein BJ165DRAFT_1419873 [Panaeolus papilionaceus]
MFPLRGVVLMLSTLLSLALVAKSSPNPVKRQTPNRCDSFRGCVFVNSRLAPPIMCQSTPTGCCTFDIIIAMSDCYRCYYQDRIDSGGAPLDMTQAQLGVDGLYNSCRANGARIPISFDAFTLPGQDINRSTVDRGRNPTPSAVSTSSAPGRSTLTVVVDPTASPTAVPAKGHGHRLKALSFESLVLTGLAGVALVML